MTGLAKKEKPRNDECGGCSKEGEYRGKPPWKEMGSDYKHVGSAGSG